MIFARNALAFVAIALACIFAEATVEIVPVSLASACEGSLGEQHECTGTRLAVAESELARLVKALLEKLNLQANAPSPQDVKAAEVTQNRLLKSQTAWIGFREADCSLKGIELLGGPGHDLLVRSCQLDHTDSRIKELRNLGI